MTVAELIAELQRHEPHKSVVVTGSVEVEVEASDVPCNIDTHFTKPLEGVRFQLNAVALEVGR